MSVAIRVACLEDIPAALQLCRAAGWNQIAADWRRLLEYEPEGCFVAQRDDAVVGTVTTTRHGNDLAWIGMMLVHPEQRRQGIAVALMNHSLQYLADCGVRCIKLDATPEGEHVYEQIGFSAEWTMTRWRREPFEGNAEPLDATSSSFLDRNKLHDCLQSDRKVFGADRSEWIRRLLSGSEIRRRGAMTGLIRPGFLASYLGPFFVDPDADASEIIADGYGLIGELVGGTSAPVFWDIPDPNLTAVEVARMLRFEPTRKLTRMWMGSRRVESDVSRLFGLSDPSTG